MPKLSRKKEPATAAPTLVRSSKKSKSKMFPLDHEAVIPLSNGIQKFPMQALLSESFMSESPVATAVKEHGSTVDDLAEMLKVNKLGEATEVAPNEFTPVRKSVPKFKPNSKIRAYHSGKHHSEFTKLEEIAHFRPSVSHSIKGSQSEIDQRTVERNGILLSNKRLNSKKKRRSSPLVDMFQLADPSAKTSSPNIPATALAHQGKRLKSKSVGSKQMHGKRMTKVKFDRRITVHHVPADEERGSYEWRKNLTRQGIFEAMMWKAELEKLGCYD